MNVPYSLRLVRVAAIFVGPFLAPFAFSWSGVAVFAILYVVTGLGITVGYHRLLAHRSFATSKFVEGTVGVGFRPGWQSLEPMAAEVLLWPRPSSPPAAGRHSCRHWLCPLRHVAAIPKRQPARRTGHIFDSAGSARRRPRAEGPIQSSGLLRRHVYERR